MSEKKKDMKAFLAKQSKKVKKTTAAAEPVQNVEEEKTLATEVTQNKEQIKKKVEKQESSDEEVDDEQELESGMNLGFAKIKELKDVKVKEEIAESEKLGYGFDDQDKKNSGFITRSSAAPTEKKAAATGEIQFGGRPMKFGRRKVTNTKFADDFNDDLGDIGDDGKIQKKNKNTEVRQAQNDGPSSNMVGGREWVNLGAGARDMRDQDEEEKREPRVPGVKPTFKRGTKNTGSTVVVDKEEGVRPSYDFKVSYKTSHDQEGGERRQRDPKDKGVSLNEFDAKKAQNDDDDDFQIIRGREKKVKVARDGSSSEEGGFTGNRGEGERGARGGMGARGGGFFKNSSKRID